MPAGFDRPDTSPPRPVLCIGLTGGIASGKSTVSRMLAERGAHVVDADEVAHAVIDPGGPAHEAVVERFGREILGADGRVDRRRLAQQVFGDGQALEALNAIVHPRIRAESARHLQQAVREGRSWLVIYDAALLVETGAHRDLDGLIVVACEPELQIQRLEQRNGMSVAEAEARIDAQLPLDDKVELADWVVDNNGTMDETRRGVERLVESLRQTYRKRFGRSPAGGPLGQG